MDNVNSETVKGEDVSRAEIKERLKAGYDYLQSNIILIIIVSIIGLTCGIIFSFLNQPLYSASSTFVLEEKESSGGMGSYAGIASQFGISLNSDGGGGLFQSDNIIELYKSRSMLEKTLLTTAKFDNKSELLIDKYIDIEGFRKKWSDNPQLSNINFSNPKAFTRKQDSIITVIIQKINEKYLAVFKPDKKLSIIDVTVTAHDELFAMYFDEKLVENVNQFYTNTKIKNSLNNVKILQFQTDSIRKLLNNSLAGVAASVDASPNANPFNQSLKVPSQKRQIDVQTNSALYAEMVKNLALAQITLRQEEPLIQLIDTPILPLEKSRVGIIKGAVIGLFLGFTLSCAFLIIKKLLF